MSVTVSVTKFSKKCPKKLAVRLKDMLLSLTTPALRAGVWEQMMSQVAVAAEVTPDADASGLHPVCAPLHVAIAEPPAVLVNNAATSVGCAKLVRGGDRHGVEHGRVDEARARPWTTRPPLKAVKI